MVNYIPAKLIEYLRDGLVEQEHSGFIVFHCEKLIKIGEDYDYPFYLRSCAKPLQASLLIDLGLDSFYNMTPQEIALCCASHTGEDCHVQVGKNFLKKIGFSEEALKCGLHKPISKEEQQKLLLSGEKENIFQNNCSGKHIMMLAICKKMGWDIDNYDYLDHPLQLAIKQKIYELCEVNLLSPLSPEERGAGGEGDNDYPVTKDGCGVPIISMPLDNMLKGYINLFTCEKYYKIRDSFVQNPYLIGGYERLDTAIMSVNKDLVAKVGAGGICIVINLKKSQGIIVKIMDCDMKARAIVLIEALKQLGWLDTKMLENDLIKAQNKRDILTLHKEKIGEIHPSFLIEDAEKF